MIEKEIKDQCLRISFLEGQLKDLDDGKNPYHIPDIAKIALLKARMDEIIKLGEMVYEYHRLTIGKCIK